MASDAPILELDPHAAVIARAERRRAMLEHLAEVGTALADEIAKRFIDGPYYPEPRNDPGRSFAAVSRAVRLTLALEGKLDEQIVALRNGSAPVRSAPASVDRGASTRLAPERVRDMVKTVLSRETGDKEEADRVESRIHECLVEREDYEALLSGDLRQCVEAICSDLGLDPDWSCWSDEEGFVRASGDPLRDWPSAPDGTRSRLEEETLYRPPPRVASP